jgi:excisionase family DNA binding protein
MRLLTAKEVANILRVSTARVYALARTNSIPSITLGQRQLRFDEAALRNFIALAMGRNCSAAKEVQN